MIDDAKREKAKAALRRISALAEQGKLRVYDNLTRDTDYLGLAMHNGRMFGLMDMLLTTAILVNIDNEGNYERRYCYERREDAVLAFLEWDGEGDPPGPWIKEKPSERLGPGATNGGDTP